MVSPAAGAGHNPDQHLQTEQQRGQQLRHIEDMQNQMLAQLRQLQELPNQVSQLQVQVGKLEGRVGKLEGNQGAILAAQQQIADITAEVYNLAARASNQGACGSRALLVPLRTTVQRQGREQGGVLGALPPPDLFPGNIADMHQVTTGGIDAYVVLSIGSH